MMEALVLAGITAVLMPLPVVMILRLLLPEEEIHGRLQPLTAGLLLLQLLQSEEEVRAGGRCCLVPHPWATAIARYP